MNEQKRVKASGPRPCNIAIVGMAPASEEVIQGKPFVGTAGRILNMALQANHVSRDDVYVTNVLEFPIKVGSSIFDLPPSVYQPEVDRLHEELKTVNPNVVMALGDEPMFFLTGKHGIMKWRGSILPCEHLPGVKCIPSTHPAWISRGNFKWLPIFEHIDLKRALADSKFKEFNLPKRDALTGPSFRTALDYILCCNEKEYLSFDIETAWWAPTHMGEIACVGIGWSPAQALCIPLIRGNGTPYWTVQEEIVIWRELAKLLQNPSVRKIAQNAAFEWIYFWSHGIYPHPLFIDTMLLHHCLYPDFSGTEDLLGRKKGVDEPGHGLAFINSQYTRTPYYKDDGRLWNPIMGEHQLWQYNCLDVMTTMDAGLQMMNEAIDDGLWEFYKEFYNRPFPHAMRMEWFGTPIDIAMREEVGREIDIRIGEIQTQMNEALGYRLNVNSPKQMQEMLYKKKGYQVKKNRKTGKASADKNVLQYFASKYDDTVLHLILELRQLLDTKSDVINQKVDDNGNIHTHYKIGGTDGARWSSSKSILGSGTNLQNIPRDGIARRLFVAR